MTFIKKYGELIQRFHIGSSQLILKVNNNMSISYDNSINEIPPTGIQVEALEIGKLYKLPKPIQVESFRVRAETRTPEKRSFLFIRPVEKRDEGLVCTGRKIRKIQNKLKNCDEKYFFTLTDEILKNN